MWTTFKVYWICYNTASVVYVAYVLGVSGQEAWGILAPRPGIKPALPALEDKVLTTELPGKSPR